MNFFFLLIRSFCFVLSAGSRHQTPDTVDERINNVPSRSYGGGGGGGYQKGGRGKRDNRRDDRRRTNDDEETILDSQDVSSVDRGNKY